jgi:ankyrin repeat protein/uncharacterized protein YecT (DUF1311 family)
LRSHQDAVGTIEVAKFTDFESWFLSMRMPWLLLLFLLGCPVEASAASFDCAKGISRVEKLICGDSDLSNLDDKLAVEYRAARRTGLSDSQVSEQRAWIVQRNSCENKECVKQLYESRIAKLVRLESSLSSSPVETSGSVEYVVKCDSQNGILSIHELGAPGTDPSEGEPSSEAGVIEYRIQSNALTKSGGTDMDPLLLPASTERFQCRLAKALYRITIVPYIFDARVMGQCGAAEPVISVEVTRNGKVILSDQRFATCIGHSRLIHRVRLDERNQSMRILATLDVILSPIRIEKGFRFSALPKNLEEEVFEAFPTGDLDVDLFVAVRRCNTEYVREFLAKGATPNARDLNGFTPIAYLWRSGWERPVPGQGLKQEGCDAAEIARLLVGKGASGNVRNNHGVSLLDYLILGDAPPSVIDLLLQNGADPKTDRSLSNASLRGDPALVEKLLALGADPNGKGPDGLTALWSASTSGFYSWGNRPTPPIDEYVRCVRLLLQHGAKVGVAIRDPEGLLWLLVRSFSQDERLKLILNELIPYSSNSAVKRAYDVSLTIPSSQGGVAFRDWFDQFVRP